MDIHLFKFIIRYFHFIVECIQFRLFSGLLRAQSETDLLLHFSVFRRNHLDDLQFTALNTCECRPCFITAGEVIMAIQQMLHFLCFLRICDISQFNHFTVHIHFVFRNGSFIDDIRDAAAHPCSKIFTDITKYYSAAAGHVLKTVISYPLDDNFRTTVPYTETLAGHTVDERLAAYGTVQAYVACDDFMAAVHIRRLYYDAPARNPLADVVVQIPGMVQREPLRYEGAVALAAMSERIDFVMIVPEPPHAMRIGDEASQSRTDVSVPILHMIGRFVPFSRFHLFFEIRQHRQFIERPFERMRLPLCLPSVPFDLHEQRSEIKLIHLMLGSFCRVDLKMFNSTNKLIHGSKPEFCEDLPDVFSNEVHEIDDMLRLPGKQLPEVAILRRDADRTCILVAHTHHDAAEDDERCCGECEFFRTEGTRNRDIAPGHQLAVRFERHTGSQSVQLQ